MSDTPPVAAPERGDAAPPRCQAILGQFADGYFWRCGNATPCPDHSPVPVPLASAGPDIAFDARECTYCGQRRISHPNEFHETFVYGTPSPLYDAPVPALPSAEPMPFRDPSEADIDAALQIHRVFDGIRARRALPSVEAGETTSPVYREECSCSNPDWCECDARDPIAPAPTPASGGDEALRTLHAAASDLRHIASGGSCAPETLLAHVDALLALAATPTTPETNDEH